MQCPSPAWKGSDIAFSQPVVGKKLVPGVHQCRAELKCLLPHVYKSIFRLGSWVRGFLIVFPFFLNFLAFMVPGEHAMECQSLMDGKQPRDGIQLKRRETQSKKRWILANTVTNNCIWGITNGRGDWSIGLWEWKVLRNNLKKGSQISVPEEGTSLRRSFSKLVFHQECSMIVLYTYIFCPSPLYSPQTQQPWVTLYRDWSQIPCMSSQSWSQKVEGRAHGAWQLTLLLTRQVCLH